VDFSVWLYVNSAKEEYKTAESKYGCGDYLDV
jgi:hypothetical protein